MKNVVINGKEVAVKKIDFNAICELEDLGFSIAGLKDKTFSSIRAIVAFNLGVSAEEASKEIEGHLKNGGKLQDFAPLLEMIAESDFFQSLTK